MPYFYNQSLAFKMRMTAYKNIQFRFKGTYEGAFDGVVCMAMLIYIDAWYITA